MRNIEPGPDARIDDCRTIVTYADIGADEVAGLPVRLVDEEGPSGHPEPCKTGTVELENGAVAGVFYGKVTRRLSFFPAAGVADDDWTVLKAILRESGLPGEKVSFRWDRDPAKNPVGGVDADARAAAMQIPEKMRMRRPGGEMLAPAQMERWKRIRAMGRMRYVLVHGVLWGLLIMIGINVVKYLIFPESFDLARRLPGKLVIYGVGGALLGLWMWKTMEKAYANTIRGARDGDDVREREED